MQAEENKGLPAISEKNEELVSMMLSELPYPALEYKMNSEISALQLRGRIGDSPMKSGN